MKEFFLQKTETDPNLANWEKAWNEMPFGWIKVKMQGAKKRSNPQNRYLWGCVYPLALQGFREIGYDEIRTEEQVHEIFKNLFLKDHYENHVGLVMEYVKSTSDLTRLEFINYLESARKFCSENLNVFIPDPGTQTEMPYFIASPIPDSNALLISK